MSTFAARARARAVSLRETRGEEPAQSAVFTTGFEEYADRPVHFAEQVLGQRIWSKQGEILEGLASCDQVGVAAAQKLSKTRTFGVAAFWYVATRPRGLVLATSATFQQVVDPFWADLRNIYTADVQRRLGGPVLPISPITGLRWPDGRRILGRNPRDADAAGGVSSPQLLLIADEASGIREVIFEAWEGNRAGGDDGEGDHDGRCFTAPHQARTCSLGTKGCVVQHAVVEQRQRERRPDLPQVKAEAKLLMGGNPLRTSGKFFASFHNARAAWLAGGKGRLIEISAYDSPNVTGEMRIPGVATRAYIARMRLLCGGKNAEAHPAFQARVLGKFPTHGTNNVVTLGHMADAHDRWDDAAGESDNFAKRVLAVRKRWAGQLVLGVDPARMGDDETAVQPVRGLLAVPATVMTKLKESVIAAEVARIARELRVPGEIVVINVDGHGVGEGVISALRVLFETMANDDRRERGRWVVNNVRSADTSSRPDRHFNLRSQLHFGVREWIEAGGALPPDEQQEADLLAATFEIDGKGRYKVQSKDEIKAKLGRSPDRGDALALAVYMPAHVVDEGAYDRERNFGTHDPDATALG